MRKPRTRDGFVLCENCDNFASKELFEAVGWHACGACCFGEADALEDYQDRYMPYQLAEMRATYEKASKQKEEASK